ncbi:MAG: hypothetical protein PHY12_14505 [Eubacteriales bacterium]|nr:hypothetical protein [Eubacteriales bacterium]
MKAIADAEEVLRFVTEVLRGDDAETQLRDRLKAAEMLGKRYDLFAEGAQAQGGSVTIVDDVRGPEK